MENSLPYIFIISVTWFVTHLEPLQSFIEGLLSEVVQLKNNKYLKYFIDVISEILTCWYCQAFWVTFLYSFNFLIATVVSLIVWILSRLDKKI